MNIFKINMMVKRNKKSNGKSGINFFSHPDLILKYNVHINTIIIYKSTIYKVCMLNVKFQSCSVNYSSQRSHDLLGQITAQRSNDY